MFSPSVFYRKKHSTTQASLPVFYRTKHHTTEHCTAQPGLSETIIRSTLRLRPFRRHRHRLTRCSPNTEFIVLLFWLFFLPNICFLIILSKLPNPLLTKHRVHLAFLAFFLPNMCFRIILPKMGVFRPSLKPHSPSR